MNEFFDPKNIEKTSGYYGDYVEDVDFNKQKRWLFWGVKNIPFRAGRCYDDKPADMYKCSKCGGVKFHIAQGSYGTFVRCIKCMIEICVHAG